MNARLKKRLIAVSGVIILTLIIVLAVVGGGTAARTVNVAEALQAQSGEKIQVSGNVVRDSYSTTGNVLTFEIYNPEVGTNESLKVRYGGAASSTFGNDVTAICTGRMKNGVLECSELVTKCPSKYENSANALTLEKLLGYGSDITGKPVKVAGTVQPGTLKPAGGSERFVLIGGAGEDTSPKISVSYNDALANEITDGSTVILTGSVNEQGKFVASEVALEG